jgi:hypothetical protein
VFLRTNQIRHNFEGKSELADTVTLVYAPPQQNMCECDPPILYYLAINLLVSSCIHQNLQTCGATIARGRIERCHVILNMYIETHIMRQKAAKIEIVKI